MAVVLLILLYIFIGIIIGVSFYVFVFNSENYNDQDSLSAIIGVFWIIAIPIAIIFSIFAKITEKIYNIAIYFKKEGLHYYRGNLKSCCGKCKYTRYVNYHNDLNICNKTECTKMASTSLPCEQFKKHPFWRFRVRIEGHWKPKY